MSLLAELVELAKGLGLPYELGVFSDDTKDQYLVFTPITHDLELFADNLPQVEIEAIRCSLFIRGNYKALLRRFTKELLDKEITVSARRYVAFEKDTGYHHLALDCEKAFEWRN